MASQVLKINVPKDYVLEFPDSKVQIYKYVLSLIISMKLILILVILNRDQDHINLLFP